MAEDDETGRVGSRRATIVLNGRGEGVGEAGSLVLPENEVHLWVADHRVDEDELEACSSVLDAGERERASRFRFHKDFRRFVFGHARVRSILALYTGSPADALGIARRCATCGSEDHGKPYLLPSSGAPPTMRFSCSYSDQLVVVAVSNGAEIGVDVERVVPDFPWRQVAESALSSEERSLLDALDPEEEEAARAFYGIWTRKEAVSKASAQGLEQLTQLDTCAWSYGEGGTFEVDESSSRPSWVGKVLDIPGHEAAIALEGGLPREWSVVENPLDVQARNEGA